MKVVAGLGNPGAQYARTRHNAGFLVVDELLARHAPHEALRCRFHAAAVQTQLPGAGPCLLLKPMTYMNRSGLAVAEAVRFYKVCVETDLLVVVDDVALPAGAIRLRERGGAGGHKGLLDIERALGTSHWARLRVGIDSPGDTPQADYVLQRFRPEQWALIEPAVQQAADAVEVWARQGAAAAMNRFNVRARENREAQRSDEQTPQAPSSAKDGARDEDAPA
ncbi:MAG: aminoacyl-tRNA hydrolase [Planctomycetota bacterium]|nr:MAG: aminoacyl-tRNA hydrolase [Planctomycetota bacterium]